MIGYLLVTFVVAGNSQGESELLAYDIDATQDQLDNGHHYDIAMSKARSDGYVPITAFDANDMAGMQLLGQRPLYGEKPRYTKDISQP